MVSLEGAPKPLTFLLVSGGGRYDADLSVHVADRGPHAKVEILTRPDAPDTGAPFLTGMLQGVPPADADAAGCRRRFTGWHPGLAPRAECLSAHALHAALAEWTASEAEGGTTVYAVPNYAVVLLSVNGRTVSALLKDLPDVRCSEDAWRGLAERAGRAGPRRLAVIAMSGTAIVVLVVVVALSGHKAVPVSQDARMKPVDPLPGGLHSTPRECAGLRGSDAAGAGRARAGRSSDTPALAPSVPMFPSPTAPGPDDTGPYACTRTPAGASAACRGSCVCHAPGSRRDAHADRRTRAGHSRAGRGRSKGSQRPYNKQIGDLSQPMGRPASEDRNGSSRRRSGRTTRTQRTRRRSGAQTTAHSALAPTPASLRSDKARQVVCSFPRDGAYSLTQSWR